MVRFQHPAPHAAVKALLSVLDFRRCRTVLDPWAGQSTVSQAFNSPGSNLITNDPWGKGDLHFEPLETHLLLYRTIENKSRRGRFDSAGAVE
jgi:hypothetical protein